MSWRRRFEDHEADAANLRDAAPLRAVRAAVMAGRDDALARAVHVAARDGHSWAGIAAMIGTSGDEARARFGPSHSGLAY